ncbi:MAG: protein-S-isoprenylcysteine O-methyltransferase [Pseudomonadota bacterium]
MDAENWDSSWLASIFRVGWIGIVALGKTNGYGTIIWIASFPGISLIRAPDAKRNADKVIVDQPEGAKERVLLALVFVGATILPLVLSATGALAFANYTLPIWAPAIGGVLVVPGQWLFWRSHADLGRNWSIATELHEEQTLVTSGVYSRIRQPMYSANWLMFLAQPLLIQKWIAGWAGPIAFAVVYFNRVPYEEAMMRKQFGEEYDAYMQRSGRLLLRYRLKSAVTSRSGRWPR